MMCNWTWMQTLPLKRDPAVVLLHQAVTAITSAAHSTFPPPLSVASVRGILWAGSACDISLR